MQLIEEITDDSFSYHLCEQEFPFAEWFLDTDVRKVVLFPQIPAGYKLAPAY